MIEAAVNLITPQKTSTFQSEEYSLSFGTGGLYVIDSVKLIQSYTDLSDWSAVIESAVEKNLLKFKSAKSTRRAVGEICKRLKSLTSKELKLFETADTFDQALICWLACCRTYQFIGDFATQVVLEKFDSYKLELDHAAFDFFYDDQAQFHPELDDLAETTRTKLRQILFRMLREAGILTDDNRIVAGIASQSLKDINDHAHRDLHLFVPGAV
jgi:hypothetical protein